jgi:hypothetical protein
MYHPKATVQHEIPASRLTQHYLQRCANYQGVCDSYTNIRIAGRVFQPAWSWEEPLHPVKRFVDKLFYPDSSMSSVLKNRVAKAYKLGYNFHQTEVRRDVRLLEWALRKDYWDYTLPDGWQSYLK